MVAGTIEGCFIETHQSTSGLATVDSLGKVKLTFDKKTSSYQEAFVTTLLHEQLPPRSPRLLPHSPAISFTDSFSPMSIKSNPATATPHPGFSHQLRLSPSPHLGWPPSYELPTTIS